MVSESPPTDAKRSALFAVLAHSRRRRILALLLEHRSLTVADVADELAAAEADAPLSETAPQTVTDVYVTLHHVHVPKLVDSGLIEHDEDRELLALAADAPRDWIEEAIELDDERELLPSASRE